MGKRIQHSFILLKQFLFLNIILLLLAQIGNLCIYILASYITNEYFISIFQILFEGSSILLGIYLYTKLKKEKNNAFLKIKFNNDHRLRTMLYIAIVCSFLLPSIFYIVGIVQYDQGIWTKLYWEDILGILVIGVMECVIEIVSEEILVRFFINEMILEYFNVKITIILSSIYYLVLHILNNGLNIVVIINLVLLNILLSNIYLTYRNIWYCIIPRSIFEFITAYGFSINRMGRDKIGIIFLDWIEKYPFLNGGQYGTYGSLITTVLLLLLIAAFFLKKRIKEK